MKKILLAMWITLVLFFSMGCSAVLEQYYSPVNADDSTEVLFEVPAGASTTGIASRLEEANLIQNANAFKLKARDLGVDGKMKAGTYKLSPSMDVEAIINKLVSGAVFIETVKFTIPEGFEVRQIVDKLSSEGLIDSEVFLKALENHPFEYPFLENIDRSHRLEGFLFPDTYEVAVGASEVFIIDLMLKRFDSVFKDAYYERAEALGMSVNEVVTLASIIEREAQVDAEFELVSSVFHNRIQTGMLLQSCATVQYVLKERKDRLTFADLEVQSPFNTYMFGGLTPGPIASPGARAIEAALYPADTKYLFFVTTEKNDGTHYFNETLAGHNKDAKKGN